MLVFLHDSIDFPQSITKLMQTLPMARPLPPLQLEYKTTIRLCLRLLLLLREPLDLAKPALRSYHLGYHHPSPGIAVFREQSPGTILPFCRR